MEKLYILQEKINFGNDYYWFDIIDSDDFFIINQYYFVFNKKYDDRVYRIIEIVGQVL